MLLRVPTYTHIPYHSLRKQRGRISRKATLLTMTIGVFLFILSLFFIDQLFSWRNQDKIYSQIDKLPSYEVALVLGTSKYLGKTLNEFYANRIDAAISLYQNNKVNTFLLSGDNAHRSYNEPWTMKRDLLKAGVPDDSIYLDYAGFRTLDSIVRSKAIFNTQEFIIVTQRFHCERALYIANYYDINAVCLAVPGPTQRTGVFVRTREVFARVKALLDLYIFGTQPKFLGPKEPILSAHNSDSTK